MCQNFLNVMKKKQMISERDLQAQKLKECYATIKEQKEEISIWKEHFKSTEELESAYMLTMVALDKKLKKKSAVLKI